MNGPRLVLTDPMFPGQEFDSARSLRRAKRKVIQKMQAMIKAALRKKASTPNGKEFLTKELETLATRMFGGAK